jgi:hypothetical protein
MLMDDAYVNRRLRGIERDLRHADPGFARLLTAAQARLRPRSRGLAARVAGLLFRAVTTTGYALNPAACAYRNQERTNRQQID